MTITFKNLLLQNHWANLNQAWLKASLGRKDSSLFKWRATSFPRGDKYEIAKIHWQNLKIFFSTLTEPISTNLAQSILKWRRLKVLQIRTIQFSKRRKWFFPLLIGRVYKPVNSNDRKFHELIHTQIAYVTLYFHFQPLLFYPKVKKLMAWCFQKTKRIR